MDIQNTNNQIIIELFAFFNVKCLVIIRNNLTFADDGNCLNSNHLCPEDTLFTVMGLVSVIRTVFPCIHLIRISPESVRSSQIDDFPIGFVDDAAVELRKIDARRPLGGMPHAGADHRQRRAAVAGQRRPRVPGHVKVSGSEIPSSSPILRMNLFSSRCC